MLKNELTQQTKESAALRAKAENINNKLEENKKDLAEANHKLKNF